jgi:hypothetical protein
MLHRIILVFEYDGVPCSIFGAGSCFEKGPDVGR